MIIFVLESIKNKAVFSTVKTHFSSVINVSVSAVNSDTYWPHALIVFRKTISVSGVNKHGGTLEEWRWRCMLFKLIGMFSCRYRMSDKVEKGNLIRYYCTAGNGMELFLIKEVKMKLAAEDVSL